MKNYSLIIWDFNGTLLDDVGAALGSVNDMLARRSKEPITLDEYREYIDVPIRHFYEQVLDLENEDYDLILNEFQQGYEAHVKNCGLTRFVSAALEEAKRLGIPQVVLSSSEQSQLERLLKHYEIDGYFDSVLGADNLLAGSKVERAEKFIEEHGARTSKPPPLPPQPARPCTATPTIPPTPMSLSHPHTSHPPPLPAPATPPRGGHTRRTRRMPSQKRT